MADDMMGVEDQSDQAIDAYISTNDVGSCSIYDKTVTLDDYDTRRLPN